MRYSYSGRQEWGGTADAINGVPTRDNAGAKNEGPTEGMRTAKNGVPTRGKADGKNGGPTQSKGFVPEGSLEGKEGTCEAFPE